MLFPNLGLAETESDWSIFHITPLTAEKTLVQTRSKFMPMSGWTYTRQQWSSWKYLQSHGQKRAPGPDVQAEDDPLASGDFMAEDIYICEQLQHSLRSPHFSVGATAADLEQPIVQFQTIVKNWLEAA